MSGDNGMPEAWAPIPSVLGYEASSLGRIRSVDRMIVTKAGVRKRTKGVVLRPKVGRKGYLLVNPGSSSMRLVHHLVLEAFVGPRPPGMVCRHKDNNPAHNAICNLLWGTPSENIRDSVAAGSHSSVRKTTCPLQHPLVQPNLTGSSSRRGRRGCLACNRANAMLHRLARKGMKVEMRELADKYYHELMGGEAA